MAPMLVIANKTADEVEELVKDRKEEARVESDSDNSENNDIGQ